MIITLIIFFILGLIAGSFLNVVIYRLDLAESIFIGRSHCPHCKAIIRWYDNIPLISFILLKGRCRYCGEKISWQYPVVEFLTGVLFVLTAFYFFRSDLIRTWMEIIFYLGLFSLLMIIAVYDFKFLRIPMVIVWLAIGWVSSYYLLYDSLNFTLMNSFWDSRFISGLIGGAVISGFFLFLTVFSKEKWMGWGDVYIGFLIGLVVGWPNILWVLILAFTTGAMVGLALIALKRKTMKSQLPFAPFLIFSLISVIFLLQSFPQMNNYLNFYPIF